MKVIVTKAKNRKYSFATPLLRMEGEDITNTIKLDRALSPWTDTTGTYQKVVNHLLGGDKLIYFPHLDFAYWLDKSEYEEVTEE